MITLFFDCYSGVSGDMILAALLDLGVDQQEWLKRLAGLSVGDFEVRLERTKRQGLSAHQIYIEVKQPQSERHLSQIREIIDSSRLSEKVKTDALAVFRCLAEAEARVHGVSVEEVHFHEVGAVDAIVDVVGVCIALEMLEVNWIYSSTVSLGSGFAQCQHGVMPLPPPATAEILRGSPVHLTGIETELATPTGAAILKTLADFNPPPGDLKLLKVGYGAGKKVIPQLPNVLRALLFDQGGDLQADQALLIETNIDDMNPELYPYVIQRLLESGAMDAYLIPVIMKKGRPGIILSTLCSPQLKDILLNVIFRETSTLGLRIQRVDRLKLIRQEIQVKTPWGAIRGKESEWEGQVRVTPEFEDCKRISLEKGVPLQQVYEAFNKSVDNKKR
ncbi:MAG: nickel pincer cofactor biosynthesis protein LarC [bacterium]